LALATLFQLRSDIGSIEGRLWAFVFDIKLSLNAGHYRCSQR